MMKKILLLTGLILVGFCSCRKDRTCNCTTPDGTSIGSASYINVKKSEAKEYCAAFQATYSSGSEVSCVVR